MESPVEHLKPLLLWKHFAALATIPRCSGAEAAVRTFIKALAASWNLNVREDTVGNLVVVKPASAGRENDAAVVLQSHLDMVCEQNRGRGHDFQCDPIELVNDKGWIRANDTTLGADNGIGAAAMLAILEDTTLVHGPLEALFTVDEETALTGALGLDPSLITGKTLVNLDSEDEGHFTIGCAGGMTTWSEIPASTAHADNSTGWSLTVRGLPGGHSGIEIHEQRGNALTLAGRLLSEFFSSQRPGTWQVARFEGGDKHNAIPRECVIELAGPADGASLLEDFLQTTQKIYAAELGAFGRDLVLELAPLPVPSKVLNPAGQNALLDVLAALPDGVQSMSRVAPGLVETSCNVASVRVDDGIIRLVTSQRSSSLTQRDYLARRIESVVRLAGGRAKHGDGYPAWAPAERSAVRDLAVRLWKAQTGRDAVVELIHAGLECGVIGDKVPGLDMISFGPTILGAHTPQERVEIATVVRFYDFLVELLKELS